MKFFFLASDSSSVRGLHLHWHFSLLEFSRTRVSCSGFRSWGTQWSRLKCVLKVFQDVFLWSFFSLYLMNSFHVMLLCGISERLLQLPVWTCLHSHTVSSKQQPCQCECTEPIRALTPQAVVSCSVHVAESRQERSSLRRSAVYQVIQLHYQCGHSWFTHVHLLTRKIRICWFHSSTK